MNVDETLKDAEFLVAELRLESHGAFLYSSTHQILAQRALLVG